MVYCNNLTSLNVTKRNEQTCTGFFSILLCFFNGLGSTSLNGGAISVISNGQVSVISSECISCIGYNGGGMFFSGIGSFYGYQNCFHNCTSEQWGYSIYSSSTATSNQTFSMNTISQCSNAVRGFRTISLFYYGKQSFEYNNISNCICASYDAVLLRYTDAASARYSITINNIVSISINLANSAGVTSFFNIINTTQRDTEHKYLLWNMQSSTLSFESCIFIDNIHNSLIYQLTGASFTNCLGFNNLFLTYQQSKKPTFHVFPLSNICYTSVLNPTFAFRKSKKLFIAMAALVYIEK